MPEPTKIILHTADFPKSWLSIAPGLEKMGPLAGPKDPDGQPSRIESLGDVVPRSLMAQERSLETELPIPAELFEPYFRIGRPTSLERASRLEAFLKTPARIYYKREDISYSTSDKTNTSIPQAFYAARDGFSKVVSGGGAVWGSALSIGASYQHLKCEYFMPQSYIESKKPHRILMEVNGVKTNASPSQDTEVGKKVKAEHPDAAGNVSLAVSEAVESAGRQRSAFVFGSFFRMVAIHQSVVGLESKKQMEIVGRYPDIVIGSIDDFLGLAAPFIADRVSGVKGGTKFVAAESKYVPALTQGKLDYDFADYAGLTPMYRFHSLGHSFNPPAIHAGELRYHAVSPLLSHLVEHQIVGARDYSQSEVFEAGVTFSKCQGVIPSHEAQYAVKAAIDEAVAAKQEGKEKTILFNLSGHTMLEYDGYSEYLFDKKLNLS